MTIWSITPTSSPTLAQACSQAQPGDTILLSGVWKNVTLLPRASGAAGNPIVFAAAFPGGAIFDGPGSSGVMNTVGYNYITFDGIAFLNSNYKTAPINGNGLLAHNCHDVTVQNCMMNYMQLQLNNCYSVKVRYNTFREFVGKYNAAGVGYTAGDMIAIQGGAHDNEIAYNDMKFGGHSLISVGDGFGGTVLNNWIHHNILSNPWYKCLILADDGTGSIIEDNQCLDANNTPALLSTLAQNQLPASWPRDGKSYAQPHIQLSGSNFVVRNNLLANGVAVDGAISLGSRWYYDVNHPSGVLVESNGNQIYGNRIQSSLGAAAVSFELNYTPGTDPTEPTLTGNLIHDNEFEDTCGPTIYSWDGTAHREAFLHRSFKGASQWSHVPVGLVVPPAQPGNGGNYIHDNSGMPTNLAACVRLSEVDGAGVLTTTVLGAAPWDGIAAQDIFNNNAFSHDLVVSPLTPPSNPYTYIPIGSSILGALRTFLEADQRVTALAGSNIFAGSLPRSLQGAASPPTAVLLRRVGGGSLGTVNEFGDKRIDVDCYGENEKVASDLFDAVYAALKGMGTTVVNQVLFHWCICVADGTSGHDPQTTWPVCIGTFQALVSEVAAL